MLSVLSMPAAAVHRYLRAYVRLGRASKLRLPAAAIRSRSPGKEKHLARCQTGSIQVRIPAGFAEGAPWGHGHINAFTWRSCEPVTDT